MSAGRRECQTFSGSSRFPHQKKVLTFVPESIIFCTVIQLHIYKDSSSYFFNCNTIPVTHISASAKFNQPLYFCRSIRNTCGLGVIYIASWHGVSGLLFSSRGINTGNEGKGGTGCQAKNQEQTHTHTHTHTNTHLTLNASATWSHLANSDI